MKLNLNRIAEIIRSKESGNGPEDPMAKVREALAKQGLEIDQKTKKVRPVNPNKPMPESDMQKIFADTLASANITPEQLQNLPGIKTSYRQFSEDVVPETGDALKKRMLAEGIFVEKDGDFFPTEKYRKLKKEGMLYKYRM